MASLALKQAEVKDLLDTIMVVVEEKRINAGQQFEKAARKVTDGYDEEHNARQRDFYHALEGQYKVLIAELNHVIEDTVGEGWRQ